MHYSDKFTDMTYKDILVSAWMENRIVAFTGDGTNPQVMENATAAIAKENGQGIPTIKPWNRETIKAKMDLVHKAGVFAVAMDIDGPDCPF